MSLLKSETSDLCHLTLAHINSRNFSKLDEHVLDVPKLREMKVVRRSCGLGKAHILTFPGHFAYAQKVEAIVHSDIL